MKLPERMITSGKLPAVKNLLLVGTALIFSAMITPAMAGKPVCDDGPPCKSGGGGGDGTFSVHIDGAVTGGSDTGFDWLASFGGKSTIGLNSATGAKPGVLNLGSFPVDFALECFGTEDLILTQVNLKQGRAGNLNGKFFFLAFTEDGTSVSYLLEVFGTEIDGDWPPTTTTSTLTMTDWELSVQNVGRSIKDVSCIGEGVFADADPFVDDVSIAVTRTN